MKFTPLLDRILIKPIPAAAQTLSGLHLPEAAAKSLNTFPTGTVVAAGPGQFVNGQFCPTGPKLVAGATVAYAPVGGTTVQHDGEDHLLVREADVFSVLT